MALVGGGSRHLKRLAAPKSWKVRRKRRFGTWITNVIPGPHPRERSIPLRVLLRDLLGLAQNAREADYIVKSGKVLVDGIVRREPRFPVGLMDVVEIPEIEKAFRILLDEKGRISPKEIPTNEKEFKLVRVEKKMTVRGGKTQITTHDGRNFLLDDPKKVNVGDVLKIRVPSQDIVDVFALKEGNLAYVLSGRHAGTIGQITAVIPGDVIRERSVGITVEGEKMETASRNVFVVGRDSPALSM